MIGLRLPLRRGVERAGGEGRGVIGDPSKDLIESRREVNSLKSRVEELEEKVGDSVGDGSIVYRYTPRPHTVYINATNRCSNDCTFCVRYFRSGLSGSVLWLKDEPTADLLWEKLQGEIGSTDEGVVWCGFGEPTIRLDLVLSITRRIKEKYPSVRVRLDTDGQAQLRYRSRDVPRELRAAGVDVVSISLNAESEEKYNVMCKPTLPGAYHAVLKFAEECKKYFTTVRLSVVGGTQADISKCMKMAEELGCDFLMR
ncbi:MAG: TatD family nuclease-associated radical SAM protein [Candidatus Bathyarchaeia archaeon]